MFFEQGTEVNGSLLTKKERGLFRGMSHAPMEYLVA
jgi:hypothetical protein